MNQQCALAGKGPTVPWGTAGPALLPGEEGDCPAVLCALWPHLKHGVQL